MYNINQSITLGYNWYFWMIIGVYLFIPIINKFIQNANMKELEYFVFIILIGSLLYQLTLYYKITHFLDITFFIGPLSFLILGYYLSIKKFKISSRKILLIATAIFIITTALKMGSQINLPYNLIHNYEVVRNSSVFSYLDLGFIQLIQAGAFFLIIKEIYQSKKGLSLKIKNILEKNIINKLIESGSKASYGMYLFHHTLIDPIAILVGGVSISSGVILSKGQ